MPRQPSKQRKRRGFLRACVEARFLNRPHAHTGRIKAARTASASASHCAHRRPPRSIPPSPSAQASRTAACKSGYKHPQSSSQSKLSPWRLHLLCVHSRAHTLRGIGQRMFHHTPRVRRISAAGQRSSVPASTLAITLPSTCPRAAVAPLRSNPRAKSRSMQASITMFAGPVSNASTSFALARGRQRCHIRDAAEIQQHSALLRIAKDTEVEHRNQRRCLSACSHVRRTKVAHHRHAQALCDHGSLARLPCAPHRRSEILCQPRSGDRSSAHDTRSAAASRPSRAPPHRRHLRRPRRAASSAAPAPPCSCSSQLLNSSRRGTARRTAAGYFTA